MKVQKGALMEVKKSAFAVDTVERYGPKGHKKNIVKQHVRGGAGR